MFREGGLGISWVKCLKNNFIVHILLGKKKTLPYNWSLNQKDTLKDNNTRDKKAEGPGVDGAHL